MLSFRSLTRSVGLRYLIFDSAIRCAIRSLALSASALFNASSLSDAISLAAASAASAGTARKRPIVADNKDRRDGMSGGDVDVIGEEDVHSKFDLWVLVKVYEVG